MGLMYSRRFDNLFAEADSTGNFALRTDVARAIIDWADADEQMFSPEGGSAPRTTGTTPTPITTARTTTTTTRSKR